MVNPRKRKRIVAYIPIDLSEAITNIQKGMNKMKDKEGNDIHLSLSEVISALLAGAIKMMAEKHNVNKEKEGK